MTNKFTPVTDPTEISELEKLDGALDRPLPHKPNGHLWVDSEELRAWREAREHAGKTSAMPAAATIRRRPNS